MSHNPDLEVLKTLLQMNQDHKMHERFYAIRDFKWASEIRWHANRLNTVLERLKNISQEKIDSKESTLSTLEENPPLSIEQMEMLNDRVCVPYMAILFYGHGGEPVEFREIKKCLDGMALSLKGTAEMLFVYMNKHFIMDPGNATRFGRE